ncbi:hypothetical protein [Vulcanisaeta sp. JCM 16159]|uniref:hypothetical protein n=1 Tax=Vulcanisaeta sp. JCM 16159 TaxID=1295371 RepID=UPI000AF33645
MFDDPWEQLRLSIEAVFKSWNSPRARFYREANKITPDIADCTATAIVTMVFGNATGGQPLASSSQGTQQLVRIALR